MPVRTAGFPFLRCHLLVSNSTRVTTGRPWARKNLTTVRRSRTRRKFASGAVAFDAVGDVVPDWAWGEDCLLVGSGKPGCPISRRAVTSRRQLACRCAPRGCCAADGAGLLLFAPAPRPSVPRKIHWSGSCGACRPPISGGPTPGALPISGWLASPYSARSLAPRPFTQ